MMSVLGKCYGKIKFGLKKLSIFIVLRLDRWIGSATLYRGLTYILRFLTFWPLHKYTVPFWASFLQITGYRVLRVEWYRWAARRFGIGHYMVWLVDAQDEIGEPTTELTLAFSQLEYALKFKEHDIQLSRKLNLFHYFNRSSVAESARPLLGVDSVFSMRLYKRLWYAHSLNDQDRVRKAAEAFTATISGNTATCVHVVNSILIPNGHNDIAIKLIETAIRQWYIYDAQPSWSDIAAKSIKFASNQISVRHVRASLADIAEDTIKLMSSRMASHPTQPTLIYELEALRMQLLHDTGMDRPIQLPSAEDIDSSNVDAYYWAAFIEDKKNNKAECLRLLETYLENAPLYAGQQIAGASYMLACHYESVRQFDLAYAFYQKIVLVSGVGYYLPNPIWRFVSFLMAQDKWKEASFLLIQGQKILWIQYAPLARKSFVERVRKRTLIPREGMLYLGCQGIGDDMIRLGILYRSVHSLAKFGMTCDPRMLGLLQRSLPEMEFIAPSRQSGKWRVNDRTYWLDREGVPANIDTMRVTSAVMNRAKSYNDVGLTEDILLDFVMAEGRLPVERSKPMFKVDPELLDSARSWMNSLPGKLKVAISWRSGLRDRIRNESYVDALDLGPIFKLANIDFISLQYSDTREEEAEILSCFGQHLHKMPGVDLKDDIDMLAALSLAADFVIAPGTSARELAGAVGARTLSLTTTPILPDLWRVAKDGETDKIFPSITHITIFRYKTRDAVIEEIARRLAQSVGLR